MNHHARKSPVNLRCAHSWKLGFSLTMLLPAFANAQVSATQGATSPTGSVPIWQTGSSGPPGYSGYNYTPPSRTRSSNEMGLLYASSVVYGVGMGVEFSSEVKIHDPGLFLIAPALLGVVAPVGAYALDQPTMRRGVPSAISAGLLLGAGEGLGIAGTQMVSASSANAWGFRGLSRSVAIGSTLGGVGGWLAGTWLEPPPNTSALALSGAVWGTAIGSMFGYGASPASYNFRGANGRANDWAAVGGLVGYNIGALGAAAFGTVAAVSDGQLQWMWAGAGIGAAVSLPVFLFYAGDGGPPAKRGFVFMGTATTLGIVAAAIFAPGQARLAERATVLQSAHVESAFELLGVMPWWSSKEGGLMAVGTFR
jgi:hypothetical protein